MKTLIQLSLIFSALATDPTEDPGKMIKSRVYSDPEISLCEELTIDAAVIADDNIGYVLKGNFYWRLNISTGISQQFVAKYISDRWEGLVGPIDAAFTIDEAKYRLSTVFIKNNQWFLYKGNKLTANGTTDNWSYVFQRPMMSAFEYYYGTGLRKDVPIYLMYGNDDFSKYIFHDINNPTHVLNGKAYRKGRFLSFFRDPTDGKSGTLLSSHIKPLAVMSNDNGIIIFGDKAICVAKRGELPLCNKTISSQVVFKYYGCPRTKLPTTIPTSTTTRRTTTTTTTTTTTSTTKMPFLPPKITTGSWTTKVVLTTNSPKVEITEQSFETIRATIKTTLKRSVINPTSYGTNKSQLPSNRKDEKKSNIWSYIVVIVIIVIICLIILFVVIFVVKNRNKSRKSLKKRQYKEVVINNNDKSKKSMGSVRSGSDKSLSLSDKTLPGLKSSSTVSVRSQLNSSDESLISANSSALKDPSDEEIFGKIEGKTSSNIEADQILESIKSNEDID